MANYRVREHLALIYALIDELATMEVNIRFLHFPHTTSYIMVFPNNTCEVFERENIRSAWWRLVGIRRHITRINESAHYLHKFLSNNQILYHYE